jgi:hypothetical protein
MRVFYLSFYLLPSFTRPSYLSTRLLDLTLKLTDLSRKRLTPSARLLKRARISTPYQSLHAQILKRCLPLGVTPF